MSASASTAPKSTTKPSRALLPRPRRRPATRPRWAPSAVAQLLRDSDRAGAPVLCRSAAWKSRSSKWAWADGWTRPTSSIRCSPSSLTSRSITPSGWGRQSAPLPARRPAFCRRNGTLITLPQHPEANQALGEVAAALDVRGVSAVPYMPFRSAAAAGPYPIEALGAVVDVDSPLTGAHQHRNCRLGNCRGRRTGDAS